MPGQGRSKNVAKAESVDVADLINDANWIEDATETVIASETVISSETSISSETVIITEPIVEEVKAEEKPVVVVETPKVRYATGEVHNCGILKVRKVANAKSEVVTVINRGTQVKVDFEESSETFYKVTVGKTSGFSMKAYIKIVE